MNRPNECGIGKSFRVIMRRVYRRILRFRQTNVNTMASDKMAVSKFIKGLVN
ncbi:MAG: hypothetical protein IT236_15030 [Bacteroidia bacterium]|nr:hypothetical protein [Bacteroidia bacterium]